MIIIITGLSYYLCYYIIMAEAKESGWWVYHDNDDGEAEDSHGIERGVRDQSSSESDEQSNWSFKESKDGDYPHEVQSGRSPGPGKKSFKILVPDLTGDIPVPREMRKEIDFSKTRSWKPIVAPEYGLRQDPKPHRVRLLSWNIEGLNPEKIEEKTIGLCKNILQDNPDVVILQEVIMVSQIIILEELPMYHFIPGNACSYYNLLLTNQSNYFTAILVKKEFAVIHKCKLIQIPSMMGRNILLAMCTIKGEKFCFMTSHLESMLDQSSTRKKQLKKAFNLMKEVEPDHTVIFGGDLNLRDYEVPEVTVDIYDIWEITGRREDAQYTWDMQYNDNLVFSSSGGDRRPRKRFDRLYIRYSRPVTVEPVYFELIGFERLKCGKFCSDHWGLLTHLDILSKVPQKKARDKGRRKNSTKFHNTLGSL